jgi:hypothetical protein
MNREARLSVTLMKINARISFLIRDLKPLYVITDKAKTCIYYQLINKI